MSGACDGRCACGSDGIGDDRLCEQRNVRYNH